MEITKVKCYRSQFRLKQNMYLSNKRKHDEFKTYYNSFGEEKQKKFF